METGASRNRSGEAGTKNKPFQGGHEVDLLYAVVHQIGEREPASEREEGLDTMPRPSARQVEAKSDVEQEKVDVASTEDAVINGPRHILNLPYRFEQCSGDIDAHRATESCGKSSTVRIGVPWSQPEFAGIDGGLTHKDTPFP